MTAKILFDFKFNPEITSEGKETLSQILVDTRKFDGCLGIDVIQDVKDEQHFVLLESWETKEHYGRYSAWRAGEGKTNLGSFFAAPPSITIYEVTEI